MSEEELEAESPSSLDSQTSTASYSLCPRLPITYNGTALSHLQGRPQVKICNNLSIPFPSNSECSTNNTGGNQSSDGETDDSDGPTPSEVEADSSCLQIESPTAGTGMDMPTLPTRCLDDHTQVIQAKHKVSATENPTDVPLQVRKMTSQMQMCSPIRNKPFQDHLVPISGSGPKLLN